jgi:hypothetical protein
MAASKTVGVLVAMTLLVSSRTHAATDDATLLRVFLMDGRTLVSYGEPARVGDRMVFLMPTAAGPNPPLHLVNLGASQVDWERTNRYAASARAARYLETQAEDDYLALSNQVAKALNEVSTSQDASRRLEVSDAARRLLAEWPATHYYAHDVEVRQMVSMLDEAIADLQASAASERFDLRLIALGSPPVVLEPLLPPPTPKEAIEQLLAAARVVDVPAERTVLLSAAIDSLNRDVAALPGPWVVSTRTAVRTALDREIGIDRAYRAMGARIVAAADRLASNADVGGVERLMGKVRRQDARLGGERPEAVRAVVEAVAARLDAARQLRLARDRWALRASAFRRYRAAISPSFALFARLKPALESIKSLSGTPPASLAMIERVVNQIVAQISAITPPDEFRVAHALLVTAAQLAANAGQIRREATLAGDVARAWDASSAAAGALMLDARARRDIQSLFRVPRIQ